MDNNQAILVVDDDLTVLDVLESFLESEDYQVFTAQGGFEALNILKANQVDLMISDVRMPGMGGMELLQQVRSLKPALPFMFMTGYGTIPDAVTAVKLGAIDYVPKPFRCNQILLKVHEILRTAPHRLRRNGRSPLCDVFYGGESQATRKLYDLIERVIGSDVSVLILGESGVGKELVAQLLHDRGPRREKSFVAVDCGSTPSGLLESELFGHMRGSFTNALKDKKGLIEAADSGSLFFDEIGNISPEMQVRLLRFLEGRRIRRVGGLREIPVDCRVISATNADLPSEVAEGRFREDLYYRLKSVTIRIPPLRERKEDIPLLANKFMEEFCISRGMGPMELSRDTLAWLSEQPWPGNVRELKNALEGALVLCGSKELRPADFHLAGLPLNTEKHSLVSVRPFPGPVKKKGSAPPPLEDSDGPVSTLRDQEERNILDALEKCQWVQKDAAKLLGVSSRVLNYKIGKMGLKHRRWWKNN
jgi:DNA-binding NtrC family response regulator